MLDLSRDDDRAEKQIRHESRQVLRYDELSKGRRYAGRHLNKSGSVVNVGGFVFIEMVNGSSRNIHAMGGEVDLAVWGVVPYEDGTYNSRNFIVPDLSQNFNFIFSN